MKGKQKRKRGEKKQVVKQRVRGGEKVVVRSSDEHSRRIEMKKTTRFLRRGGRRAIRARARSPRNAVPTTNLDGDLDVRVVPGVDKAINGAGETERMQVYPPKRPRAFAARRWPPNCGPRRGVEDGGGGRELQAAADGEPLLEEEEEEPEECVCCGFEDGEKDDGDGGRSRTVDGGEGVQVRVLQFYWNSMTLSWKFDE
ncbi:unnamed protein product [Linum trigynum]|uniref:Uncharacterized protein n=1 Tax=Linum trigynum TaxID=586398 RepID=A0AAV2F798_9ROSI